MKIQILIIGLFLIGIVSATYYAGETIEIPLDFEIVNCSVINNTFDLEGLDLSWNETNVTISTVQNYKPDNFTISCLIIQYRETEEEIITRSSGGGSCRYDKNFDWNCSEWSECNGIQSRICKKYNNCHNTYGKPIEIQNCTKAIGGETDEHGCVLMGGYTWCEAKQKCLREWEEPCDEIPDEPLEENNLWIFIILIVIGMIIFSIIYYVYKKKRRVDGNQMP